MDRTNEVGPILDDVAELIGMPTYDGMDIVDILIYN